jgi:hypothetical protein
VLWIEVAGEDGLFGYVPGTLARYRRHSANVTRDPLANIEEVERTLHIARERFPRFRDAVDYALRRRLLYDAAVAMIRAGRKAEAREKLFAAIRPEPLFIKAWLRLAQTLV